MSSGPANLQDEDYMEVVGRAKESGSCKNSTIPQTSQIINGTIWFTKSRVLGIDFGFADKTVFSIGSKKGSSSNDTVTFNNSTKSFIGFHGYSSPTQINSLGFLTIDN